jgi:NAD/NADP transhydrogenase beta subunit
MFSSKIFLLIGVMSQQTHLFMSPLFIFFCAAFSLVMPWRLVACIGLSHQPCILSASLALAGAAAAVTLSSFRR